MHVHLGDSHRLLQNFHRANCQPLRIIGMIDGRDQEHELITAHACHGIGRTHQSGQALRNLLQQIIARSVSQRVVHQLEAVQIANHERKRTAVAIGVRHGLLETVIEQHAIRQTRERVVSREVPQLAGRGLEPSSAHIDDLLELKHVVAHQALVVPLAGERRRALQNFYRLGGFSQNQKLVRVLQPLDDFRPIVIGVRGADDDVHVRIDLPEVLDGFQSIPAGRHAHIDERHGVRTSLLACQARHLDAFLALVCGVDLEIGP